MKLFVNLFNFLGRIFSTKEVRNSNLYSSEGKIKDEIYDDSIPNKNPIVQNNSDKIILENNIVLSTNKNEKGETLSTKYPIILKPNQKGKFEIEGEIQKEHKRGIMEEELFKKLWRLNPEKYTNNARVKFENDVKLIPDIAYIDFEKQFFIDIEIDEPYTHDNGNVLSIHFIGSDDTRNNIFISNGWHIIRFTEEQVVRNLAECIKSIISIKEGDKYDFSLKQDMWDEKESLKLEQKDYRNSYLEIIGKKYDFKNINYTKELSYYFKEIMDISLFKLKNGDRRIQISTLSERVNTNNVMELYELIEFYCNPVVFLSKIINQFFRNNSYAMDWCHYLKIYPSKNIDLFYKVRMFLLFPNSLIIVKIPNPNNKERLSLYESTDFSFLIQEDKERKVKSIIKRFFSSDIIKAKNLN